MKKRSPALNNFLREWVSKQDNFVLNAKGDITNEIIDGWIAVQTQKPFVFASRVLADERRVISILCTKCADIHHTIVLVGDLSDGTKRIPAFCPDKYKTEDTYEYVDWGILDKDKEKRVPVYDY